MAVLIANAIDTTSTPYGEGNYGEGVYGSQEQLTASADVPSNGLNPPFNPGPTADPGSGTNAAGSSVIPSTLIGSVA